MFMNELYWWTWTASLPGARSNWAGLECRVEELRIPKWWRTRWQRCPFLCATECLIEVAPPPFEHPTSFITKRNIFLSTSWLWLPHHNLFNSSWVPQYWYTVRNHHVVCHMIHLEAARGRDVVNYSSTARAVLQIRVSLIHMCCKVHFVSRGLQ